MLESRLFSPQCMLRSLFSALGLIWGVGPQLNSFPGYNGGVGIFADMLMRQSVVRYCGTSVEMIVRFSAKCVDSKTPV